MRSTTVSEAKAHLSRFLALAQAGESILILSRGKPVARLEPAGPGDGGAAVRFAHLVRRGVVRRPAVPLDPSRLARSGEAVSDDVGLGAALRDEREEGR